MQNGVKFQEGTHEELYRLEGQPYRLMVDKQKLVGSDTDTKNPKAEASLHPEATLQATQLSNYESINATRKVTMDTADEIAQQAFDVLRKQEQSTDQRAVLSAWAMTKKVRAYINAEASYVRWGTAASAVNGFMYPGFSMILGFLSQFLLKPVNIANTGIFSGKNMW